MKLHETFVPKNIDNRDDVAAKKGIIVVPDNSVSVEVVYADNTIEILHGDLHTRLNGMYMPKITLHLNGEPHAVFSFKRNGDTFDFLGNTYHIMMVKEELNKFVNYMSAVLFTILMKNKPLNKEKIYRNYVEFKQYLTEEFKERYLIQHTTEIFSPRDVHKRFKNKEHRMAPMMPENYTEVEVKNVGGTKWSYIGWHDHKDLFGYTMNLENLMQEPKMYNFKLEVKQYMQLNKKELKTFSKHFAECVYHHILFEHTSISEELKQRVKVLKNKLTQLFEKHYLAYAL